MSRRTHLGADLVAALARLQVHNLAHFVLSSVDTVHLPRLLVSDCWFGRARGRRVASAAPLGRRPGPTANQNAYNNRRPPPSNGRRWPAGPLRPGAAWPGVAWCSRPAGRARGERRAAAREVGETLSHRRGGGAETSCRRSPYTPCMSDGPLMWAMWRNAASVRPGTARVRAWSWSPAARRPPPDGRVCVAGLRSFELCAGPAVLARSCLAAVPTSNCAWLVLNVTREIDREKRDHLSLGRYRINS